MINYYKILEIDNFSNAAVIKSAYRIKAKQYHPDLHQSKEFEEIFKWINQANTTLSNPATKLVYDHKLRAALTFGTFSQIKSKPSNKKRKYTKEELIQFAIQEQKAEINNYTVKNKAFPYTWRISIALICMLLGLYTAYDNWFMNANGYDHVFIILGVILYFISLLYLTQFVYKKMRIQSFSKSGFFKYYESISVYGFTLLIILGPLMMILATHLKKQFHLQHYGKEVVARVIYDGKPGFNFEFKTTNGTTIRKSISPPKNAIKMSNNSDWVLIKYSVREPRIVELAQH